MGAILSACGALPSTRSEKLRARWGYEAGSSALQGGVAHIIHATNDSEKIRRLVIDVFEKYGIESFIVILLDRNKVDKKYLLGVFKSFNFNKSSTFAFYDNPIFDDLLERIVRKSFRVSLSKHGRSYMSVPLQIADYFSYFWWELFSGKLKDYVSFEKILNLTIKVDIVGLNRKISLTKIPVEST
ncbi:hypothetical protein D1869_05105 [Sulfurisphaera ohwakuensis]|uniref:Uncharacterized protein n=1 Tax=Sulfurisphaera ohwakuensis TaxID=69656 RepID=A0A650CG26_SULOH|nr:hypothetical protein D1869_05105 [Sulfurisphaera ohwakuensis]